MIVLLLTREHQCGGKNEVKDSFSYFSPLLQIFTDMKMEGLKLFYREDILYRAGACLGRLGDGSSPKDGIYRLARGMVFNSIEEFAQGYGDRVDITLDGKTVSVRDYGRGIPLEKWMESVSTEFRGRILEGCDFLIHYSREYADLQLAIVTSSYFFIESVRDEKAVWVEFEAGYVRNQGERSAKGEKSGTLVKFVADDKIFVGYEYNPEIFIDMIKDCSYVYLKQGLVLNINGVGYELKNMDDYVSESIKDFSVIYQPIHLKGDDIEIIMTHVDPPDESKFELFVDGWRACKKRDYELAFEKSVKKLINNLYKKRFSSFDICRGMVVFMNKGEYLWCDVNSFGRLDSFMDDFIKTNLGDYLTKHPEEAVKLLDKIQYSRRKH